jgi:hypothetical protein
MADMELKSLLKVLHKEHAAKKSQLDKIAFAIGALTELAGGGKKLGRPPGKTKRRTMSASARKAIGDAQRKRWAAQKAKG